MFKHRGTLPLLCSLYQSQILPPRLDQPSAHLVPRLSHNGIYISYIKRLFVGVSVCVHVSVCHKFSKLL